MRLAAHIEKAREWAFSFGEHDCCLFAADWVLTCTGQDFAAPFRGRYATRAKAIAMLGARGGLEAVVTGALGEALPTPFLAQRGDVVAVQTDEGLALGVCDGALAWFVGPHGLAAQPMEAWAKAWRV